MGKALRYLRMRAFSTKDTRLLRHGDGPPRSRLSSALDLTSVSLGTCLTVGCLVVVGQVAKVSAGPAVIIAILFAAIVTLLITLNYAELQSRYPRVQPTPYEHLFYAAGESAAFYVAWSQIATSLMYTSAISRAISANIDQITGGVIYNFTIAKTGDIFITDKYLDFIGFLFVLVLLLYVSLGGSGNLAQKKYFYAGTNLLVFVILMFLAVVGAFHFNFLLWQPQPFFSNTSFQKLVIGSSMLVPIFLSQKTALTLCDFMWLGIKPTILGTIAMTTVTSLLCFLAMGGVITLVSDVHSWIGDASVAASFDGAGVYWLKYIICPVAIIALTPYALLHLLDSINTVQLLATDQLVHAGLGYLWNDASLPLLSVLLLSVLTAFATLLFSIELCLKIAAVVTLLETLLVCSVVTVMRTKPQPQQQQEMHVPGNAPETSTLIDSPMSTPQHTDTSSSYGTVPSSLRISDAASPSSNRGQNDSDDDIDVAVEQYRLETAAQCYQGRLLTTPNNATYSRAKLTMTIFTLSLLCCFIVAIHGYKEMGRGNAAVILAFVICVLTGLGGMALTFIQPIDKVLPCTFLVKIPARPWIPIATIVLVTLLLAAMETMEWLIGVSWMVIGLVSYMVHVLCSQDKNYDHLTQPGESHDLPPDPDDLHPLTTFTKLSNGAHERDEAILLP